MRLIKAVAAIDCLVNIIAGFIVDNVVTIKIILEDYQDSQVKAILVFLCINIIIAVVSSQIERSST